MVEHNDESVEIIGLYDLEHSENEHYPDSCFILNPEVDIDLCLRFARCALENSNLPRHYQTPKSE